MIVNNSSQISIITATYNSVKLLPILIDSLIAQTDQNFEWIVADGGSSDGTLDLIENAKIHLKNVVVDSRPDFGIYDALNRGVMLSTSDFYLVVGSDDYLYSHAVGELNNLRLRKNADLISCRVDISNMVSAVRRPRWEFLYSQFAHVAGHAVGLLIKKQLHKSVGNYSRKFPIAADQLFILSAIKNGAKVYRSQMIVGRFGSDGVSRMDAVGAATEIFRVNVGLGHNFFIQLFLLLLRLVKHRQKVQSFKL